MQTYFPPSFKATSFNCSYCGVNASQRWISTGDKRLFSCCCIHCTELSYWYDGKMVIPKAATAEPMHPDMPSECQTEYQEARNVFDASPRTAAALLRLAVQKLMPALGGKGENISDDIKALVKKGLHPQHQQALDFARVIGNNAVHPGQIDLNEKPETVLTMFNTLNLIVEGLITHPKAISNAYQEMPEDSLAAIDKRDN